MINKPTAMNVVLSLFLLIGNSSAYVQPGDNPGNSKEVRGTGTPGQIAKWNTARKLGNSVIAESNGNVGIGLSSAPGEKLHLGDGNILIEGGGETALKIKEDAIFTGGSSGTSQHPIFEIGRIVQAGDGDPEFRLMYSDDNQPVSRSVLEIDRKGIVASVKPAVGSHFEGFVSTPDAPATQPVFRLNSFPKMRLEMGSGGNTDVDVAVQREDTNTLTILTGGAERVRVGPDGNVGIGIDNPQFALDVHGDVHASGMFVPSDARLKTNIVPITHALDKLATLQGVYFDWNDAYSVGGRAAKLRQIGLIAQDLKQVFPEAVIESETGFMAVDYMKLGGVFVAAINELRSEKKAQIKPLLDQLASQKQEIDLLREQNAALAERLNSMERILRDGSIHEREAAKK